MSGLKICLHMRAVSSSIMSLRKPVYQ